MNKQNKKESKWRRRRRNMLENVGKYKLNKKGGVKEDEQELKTKISQND